MVEQKILTASGDYRELDAYLEKTYVKKIFLVCGKSFDGLSIGRHIISLVKSKGVEVERFSEFKPNPDYESTVIGTRRFRNSKADIIVAVGGGSAMDVAKCIKLFSSMDDACDYTKQTPKDNNVKLLAIPTTAGTGSEATRYAVIYYDGEKLSITHDSIVPQVVLMDASALDSLPVYHKKCAMLDAFCHAVESCWSVNSTEASLMYGLSAIKEILKCSKDYLKGDAEASEQMLMAANLAGKAINITQTTAGHAMCYKLTSLYGIAHGHAAALCVGKLWPYMIESEGRCVDSRGEAHIKKIYDMLATSMECESAMDAALKFQHIVDSMGFEKISPSDNDFEILKTSVNPVRLKNHPIALDNDTIDNLYHDILR